LRSSKAPSFEIALPYPPSAQHPHFKINPRTGQVRKRKKGKTNFLSSPKHNKTLENRNRTSLYPLTGTKKEIPIEFHSFTLFSGGDVDV
jgi:hypothetical protein